MRTHAGSRYSSITAAAGDVCFGLALRAPQVSVPKKASGDCTQQCDSEQPTLPSPQAAGDPAKPRRQQAPCEPHQLQVPCFEPHASQQSLLMWSRRFRIFAVCFGRSV